MKRKRFMAMLLSVTLVISSMYMPVFAADAGAADVTAEPAVEEIAEQISEEAVAGEEDSAAEEAAEAAEVPASETATDSAEEMAEDLEEEAAEDPAEELTAVFKRFRLIKLLNIFPVLVHGYYIKFFKIVKYN